MKSLLLVSTVVLIFMISCETTPHVEIVDLKPQTKTASNHFVMPTVPDEIIFAGEQIPLEDLDIKERLDKELVINNFWHSNTMLTMKRANRWLPRMKAIFEAESVPEDLVYIGVIESGLQNVTSPRGAKGFWQFMEATAREYKLTVNSQIDERYHVEKSTLAACKYLKKAYQKFGSWILAAASYNLGVYGITDNLERQKVDNYFDLSLNPETARYIFRILAVKMVFENPSDYGFYLDSESLYPPYKTKEVVIDSTISNLYEWSVENGISMKILRKLNPWIRSRDFKVKNNESFIFKIPDGNEQLGLFRG